MSTDYIKRLYWPARENNTEKRTTYGKTIAMSAYLTRDGNRAQSTDNLPQRQTSTNVFRRKTSGQLPAYCSNDWYYQANKIQAMRSQVPMDRHTKINYSLVNPDTGILSNDDVKNMQLKIGRSGGVWGHVREVLNNSGQHKLFVDGTVQQWNLKGRSANSRQRGATGYSYNLNNYGADKQLEIQEYRAMENTNWRVMR